jgi:hypothetical protein
METNRENNKRTICYVCKCSVVRFDIHKKTKKHDQNIAKNNEYKQSREILMNIKMI